MEFDLLICIRCHKGLESVLDTAASVEWSCSNRTKLAFACDGHAGQLPDQLRRRYSDDSVYASTRSWGWGAGLFGMLLDSITYFSQIHSFQHFLTIDYDTLFLQKGVDVKLLDLITESTIGVVGKTTERARWLELFDQHKESLYRLLKITGAGFKYEFGLQGGCMLVTRSLIDTFTERNIFHLAPQIIASCNIADDHLLPILSRLCGLSVVNAENILHCSWKLHRDPRGLEQKGVYVFHPVKSDVNKNSEWEFRSYFRKMRDENTTQPTR